VTDKTTTSAGSGLPEIRPSIGGLPRRRRKPRPRKREDAGAFIARGMGHERMLEEFPRADTRYQALREAFLLRESRPRACIVVLRLPDEIAEEWPDKPEDDSPPHVSLCYLGEVDGPTVARVVEAVDEVAGKLDPWAMSMEDYGEFTNADGKIIAHMIPRSEGGPEVAQVAALIEAALIARDVVPKVHDGPFKPHATLAYTDGDYDGPRPGGRWMVERFEVWAGPDAEPIECYLHGEPGTAAAIGEANGFHPPVAVEPEPVDEVDEAVREVLWAMRRFP